MKGLLKFFILLFLPVFGFGQKALHIKGIEGFNVNVRKNASSLKEVNSIANNVLIQLIENSYLAARIDSIKEEKDSFIIYLYPDEQYKWLCLRRGNIPEELVGKIDLSSRLFLNRPFSAKNLNTLFRRTISYYENNGYPFAAVQLDSIEFVDKSNIKAALKIEKNTFYKVDSIQLNGNSSISKTYIERQLGIKENSIYNESNVSQIETRLREVPFVQLNKAPEIQYFEEKVKIILDLKKKKASRFDGVLGLLSNENDGSIELTGDVDLNLINSFNHGEAIGLNWRKLKGNSQDLNINFAYPYFLNSAFGIDFHFKLYKRDTTFIDLNTRFGINYNLRRAEYIRLFLQNKTSNLLSRKSLVANTSTSLPQIGDLNVNSFGVGYQIERLNYKYNPSKGFALKGNVAIGNKTLKKINALEEDNPKIYEGVKLQTTQYNGDLFLRKFFKIKNRSSILVANQSATTFSERLYFNELLRIGGLKLLRGFDEESINASTYSIFSLEYRFLLDRNSFFSLFTDGGYYEANYLNNFISDTPIGFGAGVSFETNAGIFTINYAVGKQFDNPIDIRAAKVHFGFINFF
ncbi:MAG: hypothetical protein DWP98_04790 [Bacteroidetes bacterium]|nr:MAG: hypothetical protein DWP98_04790 [Bacteroidota bacterium]